MAGLSPIGAMVMKLFAVSLAITATLAGCGGGQEEKRGATPLNTEPVKVVTLSEPYRYEPPKTSYIPANLPVVRAVPKQDVAPATSEETVFTVEDEQGGKPGAFELEPVRGRGYPELKVMLKARSVGETGTPQPVRPACGESGKCEYRLARNYTVSLSDGKVLQMVARGDGVS
ncbi:MAG TPA: hypothetical protein VLA61_18745, partial [Ideonella sp.]|uniref:hypothetical protein n=1 Tax=Ideonella sp. TaxID=1929293 RepID=UPI002C656FB8